MFEFRGDFTTALIVVLQFFLQVYNGEFLNRNLNNISDPFKTLIDRIEFSDSNVTCVDKEKRACVENGATGNKAKLEEVKRLLTSRKMAVGSDEDDGSEANDTSGDESKLERKETWPIINNKISQCMCVTIPWLRKAHRALELLEDYHSRLSEPQDRALRIAIERVIRIFKSRLFQALLDIQEFYELTLLDESKTTQQKTAETLQIASKWEQEGHTIKPISDNQRFKIDSDKSKDQTLVQPPHHQALHQQNDEENTNKIGLEDPVLKRSESPPKQM